MRTCDACGFENAEPDRYHRLERIEPPEGAVTRRAYRFVAWPEGEVFRRLVDYDEDRTERAATRPQTLSSRRSRWVSRRTD